MEIDVKLRTMQAVENFKMGFNCAQSVALAYADLYEVDLETIKQISASFGGGMGRLREVCGAATGAFMILGMEHPATDPNDQSRKIDNYTAVQSLGLQFKEKLGSYICADLLKLERIPQEPIPDERNSDYYAQSPCAYFVAVGAELLGNEINKSRKALVD